MRLSGLIGQVPASSLWPSWSSAFNVHSFLQSIKATERRISGTHRLACNAPRLANVPDPPAVSTDPLLPEVSTLARLQESSMHQLRYPPPGLHATLLVSCGWQFLHLPIWSGRG